jgi:hypothetical protein
MIVHVDADGRREDLRQARIEFICPGIEPGGPQQDGAAEFLPLPEMTMGLASPSAD